MEAEEYEEFDPREPLPLDDEGYETSIGMRQIYCVWGYADGSRCRALARKGTRLCYWHDPVTEEERKTGFVKTRPLQNPKPMMADPGPMATEGDLDLLLEHVARYLAGTERPDVGRAHALTNVAKHLLKSFELDELRDQLKRSKSHLRRLKRAEKPPKTHEKTPVESVPLASSHVPLPSSTGTNLHQEDSSD